MKLDVNNLGEIGLNTDLPSTELAPNVWTDIRNGLCVDGAITPGIGWAQWANNVPNSNPIWLLYASRLGVPYWFVAGDSDVYLWDASTFTQVNQAIPNAPLTGRWSGVFDGEIPYLNHIQDALQYAEFTDPNYLTSPTLKDVVYNPNGTAGNQTFRELNYQVGVVRAHKGFLFAGNWIKAGSSRPQLLAWDGGTASNTPSGDWLPTPQNLAGEFDCVDGGSGSDDNGGQIVDLLPLRDDLIVYKERSAWIARQTGSTTPVWGLKRLIGIEGIISHDCVVDVDGTHFVWGPEDIYVHQGQTATSIIDDKVRKRFFGLIDSTNYRNCYVVKNEEEKRILFCGVTQGKTYPDSAAVYHWRDGTWTITDLPEAAFMTTGRRFEAPLTWQAAQFSWESASFAWGRRNFSVLDKSVIGIHNTDKELLQIDVGATRKGAAFFTRFEREGVALNGLRSENTITRIEFSATGNGQLQIYVGGQKSKDSAVTWKGPRTFDVQGSSRIKIRSKGKLNCWRIDGQTGTDWRISDMEVHYEPRGDR